MSFDKHAAYEQSFSELDALLEGESDAIAMMASMACVLKLNLPTYFWAGFYIYKNGALIVGPYQGTVGCLHIAMGRGVCGTAAQSGETQVVKDVHQFPGHIACDARSQSEMVVPVFDKNNRLIAVFDVDSSELASFDEVDQMHLEKMIHHFFKARELTW